MLKKKWFWGSLFVLLLGVAVGGYFYYKTVISSASAAVTEEPVMQTAVARRGELVITASGTGQVTPVSQMSLGFDENGTLINLDVGVGDTVKAGDVLARLQTDNSPEEIAVSISEAELAVIQAQQALDELYDNAEIYRTEAMNDIATYAQEVRDAQYTMENYAIPTFMKGMTAIQAVDQTKAELDKAIADFEPYKYYAVTNETRQELLLALNEAQSAYDAAVKRLNYEYVLQVAEANLKKARLEYSQYENGPASDELSLAETELENARAKLALAHETKAEIELLAPMDGIVMTVDASVGEGLSASPLITLANLDQVQLEVYLDESDLDKAGLGHAAEVIFDAFPDLTFSGKVIAVNPELQTVSNVQAVQLIILLDESNPQVSLPVGLNASVDVIAGRAENAVLVPVDALREIDEGEYALFVIENDEPVLRVVQVGLQDISYAQIISGLEAGEIVSTGITQAE
jgi:multidrug efflux pump subunit AcrA (membrane-fusion protein)